MQETSSRVPDMSSGIFEPPSSESPSWIPDGEAVERDTEAQADEDADNFRVDIVVHAAGGVVLEEGAARVVGARPD